MGGAKVGTFVLSIDRRKEELIKGKFNLKLKKGGPP